MLKVKINYNKILLLIIELLTWFVKLGLPQYVSLFIQENIFIDVLHLVDEKILIDMGISKAGDRMRILNACKELKLSKETGF